MKAASNPVALPGPFAAMRPADAYRQEGGTWA
jgi:hypothetical protein